jgi:pimeloyl-ACP methyl ester carboxylesterase
MDVGGLAFRVLSSTPRDGAGGSFVLVHGIGMSHRYLARLHRELTRYGAVHSIDVPGFGGLPTPRERIPVTRIAAALTEVLERLELTDAVLVGHSMGTQWVVEAAVQSPARVAAVVAIGPVADERHRTVKAQALALAVDTLGEPLDGNAIVLTDYLRTNPLWYLAQLREMVAYPIEDRLVLLTRPLLLIRGENDTIAGLEWSRRLRERVPVGSLVMIPGRRHLAQHAAPRAVAGAIAAFRAQYSAKGSVPTSSSAVIGVSPLG